MPYITCPDGHTYSRYDNSPYVKWCKCDEIGRAQDPNNLSYLHYSKAEREYLNSLKTTKESYSTDNTFIAGMVITGFFFLVMWGVIKLFKD